jgi:hypothetical protein
MKTHYDNVQEIIDGLDSPDGFPMMETIYRLVYAVQFLLEQNAKLKENLIKTSKDMK